MDCTIRVAKTKALISFVVTAKLICVFVFAYAKSRFSHNEAHMVKPFKNLLLRNRRADFDETSYVASGTPAHHSLFK